MFRDPYFVLLCTDLNAPDTDPSDVLNLVDQVRARIPEMDALAETAAKKADAVEAELHLRYTPTGLLALALQA